MQKATLAGQFLVEDAPAAEQALSRNGIAFDGRVVDNESGIVEIHLYVDETDYEKAAGILEQEIDKKYSSIDMSRYPACPLCGAKPAKWFLTEIEARPIELLMCRCSGDSPVAFRDPVTKLGGMS